MGMEINRNDVVRNLIFYKVLSCVCHLHDINMSYLNRHRLTGDLTSLRPASATVTHLCRDVVWVHLARDVGSGAKIEQAVE